MRARRVFFFKRKQHQQQKLSFSVLFGVLGKLMRVEDRVVVKTDELDVRRLASLDGRAVALEGIEVLLGHRARDVLAAKDARLERLDRRVQLSARIKQGREILLNINVNSPTIGKACVRDRRRHRRP